MKICVIGNSHSQCLAQAWRKLKARYPGVSMTFFAYIGRYYDRFEVDKENGVLTISGPWVRERLAASSGGSGDIDFSDFDSCLIAGGFRHNEVMTMGQLGGCARRGYSKQVLDAAAKDLYVNCHINVLMPKIRALSDIPAFMIHEPMMAHKDGIVPEKLEGVSGEFDYEKGIELLNGYVRFENGPVSLPQPKETLIVPGVTKYEFSVGKRKPFASEINAGFVGELKEDRAHMKTEYGVLRLTALFDQLGISPKSLE